MLNGLFCASVQITPVEHIFLSKRLQLCSMGIIIKKNDINQNPERGVQYDTRYDFITEILHKQGD